MATPRVSILTPTYNRAEFLADAIQSVLKQTYQNYELIIIDDGSTDDTKRIVDGYKTKHPGKIQYYYQKHKSASIALNLGIHNSTGEYITFCDSDDMLEQTKLEKQMQVVKEQGVNFVHTARRDIDLISNKSEVIRPQFPARNSNDFLSGQGRVSMTVLVKKEVIIKSGMFDESLKTTYDTDMWLRILKREELVFIDEPLLTVRKHEHNISIYDIDQKLIDQIYMIRKYLRDKEVKISKKLWRKKLYDVYNQQLKRQLRKIKVINWFVESILKRKVIS